LPLSWEKWNGYWLKVHSHLMLHENLGGILGGTQCQMGDCLILIEC